MVVHIPGLRLDVTPNGRAHWRVRHRHAKRVRALIPLVLAPHRRALPALPVVVTITRCSPGTMDDDNAVASAKAVRDAIADVLGVDDRDPRVTWVVRQKRAPWGVEVEISPRTEETP